MSVTTSLVSPYAAVADVGVVRVLNAGFVGVFAGDPNGLIGGQAGSEFQAPDIVWDWVERVLWICTTAGPPGVAVFSIWFDAGSDFPAVGNSVALVLETPPANPALGLLWWDSKDLGLYIWDGHYWVSTAGG
jgi:hypothetical protein